MALKYAPFCTQCGKHRTISPTGLCSHCRRRPNPRVPCKFCGSITTNHESGLCNKCRRRHINVDLLQDAIESTKRTLCILELRERKCSFAEIGKTIGLSKTAVYEIYRNALSLPEYSVPIDIYG